MDTQDLKVFIAVAENRSFSEAADRIYLSQPAVSKRIANLETLLGTRLFDRISKSQVYSPGNRKYTTGSSLTSR